MHQTEHHAIGYIEFGVTDLDAARTFYESAFGWEFNVYGPDYSGIRSPDGIGEVGGLNANADPSTSGTLILLFSVDLESSVEEVESAGGTVIAPPYDYPGGRRFEFLDPSGNRLGVYSTD